MIGVDIVDLTDPLLKPRTSKEVSLIKHPKDSCPFSLDASTLFWLFWAAKEAFFKARRQNTTFLANTIGVVVENKTGNRFACHEYANSACRGYVEVEKNKISAVVSSEATSQIAIRYFAMSGRDPSAEIRKGFAETMNNSCRLEADSNGMPAVICNDSLLPASISHHHKTGMVGWITSL